MQEIGQKWPFLHIIKQNRSLGKSPKNRGRAIFGHEKARTLTPPKLLTKMRKTCVIWQKSAKMHQVRSKICARGGLSKRYFRLQMACKSTRNVMFRAKSTGEIARKGQNKAK